jgi:hypothetical protein
LESTREGGKKREEREGKKLAHARQHREEVAADFAPR